MLYLQNALWSITFDFKLHQTLFSPLFTLHHDLVNFLCGGFILNAATGRNCIYHVTFVNLK